MAELLNVEVLTTAAEFLWSNGITQRHNGIIANMVTKVHQESYCSFEIALAWSVAAKNASKNLCGYSPNQLVFGKNPNMQTTLNSKLPTKEGKTSSQIIADNIFSLYFPIFPQYFT